MKISADNKTNFEKLNPCSMCSISRLTVEKII